MRAWCLAVAALLLTATGADAAVVGKAVDYRIGTGRYVGYLAYDTAIKGKRPGIIVAHEWRGNDAYVASRTRMLARLGYTAFALDMDGTAKAASHATNTNTFMAPLLTDGEVTARMKAAVRIMAASKTLDPTRLGAVGYDMGGAVVLDAALNGMKNLKAVATFYGSLPLHRDAKPNGATAEFLIMYGADDPLIAAADVAAFKATLDRAAAWYTLVRYPHTVNGFADPTASERGKTRSLPMRYNPVAEEDSWWRLQVLFARTLKASE